MGGLYNALDLEMIWMSKSSKEYSLFLLDVKFSNNFEKMREIKVMQWL